MKIDYELSAIEKCYNSIHVWRGVWHGRFSSSHNVFVLIWHISTSQCCNRVQSNVMDNRIEAILFSYSVAEDDYCVQFYCCQSWHTHTTSAGTATIRYETTLQLHSLYKCSLTDSAVCKCHYNFWQSFFYSLLQLRFWLCNKYN